ncbi:hypothetical protein B0T17DRAFT_506872 [Bombardia bombarda]|uniref:Uncharacterized protein n=1 Tax=Bombardia bombarda TaxID=252184 RepID=A0AA39XBI4_9PEZI|nr:hypothetical protein B0T17DRAFT_506872 [Bombardia bombarda]
MCGKATAYSHQSNKDSQERHITSSSIRIVKFSQLGRNKAGRKGTPCVGSGYMPKPSPRDSRRPNRSVDRYCLLAFKRHEQPLNMDSVCLCRAHTKTEAYGVEEVSVDDLSPAADRDREEQPNRLGRDSLGRRTFCINGCSQGHWTAMRDQRTHFTHLTLTAAHWMIVALVSPFHSP